MPRLLYLLPQSLILLKNNHATIPAVASIAHCGYNLTEIFNQTRNVLNRDTYQPRCPKFCTVSLFYSTGIIVLPSGKEG